MLARENEPTTGVEVSSSEVASSRSVGGEVSGRDAAPGRDSDAGSELAAVPVGLELGGPHADDVRAWVEGVLGWQPVDAATAALVPVALVLTDGIAQRALGSSGVTPDVGGAAAVPSVLLLDDDADPALVAQLTLGAAPDGVVPWPSGRSRLAAVARDLLGRRPAPSTGVRTLRCGGAAGGVGTTTIALAIAGLWSWDGAATLAAVRGTAPPVRGVPVEGLAGPDLWARADLLPGVHGLRAVGLLGGAEVPAVTDPRIEAVVVDHGVDVDVDVLVCRPDAAARIAIERTTAGVVVVVGDGPLPPRVLRRTLAGRRAIAVPHSERVARAGVHGRVPAGLPGAWLRHLQPLRGTTNAAARHRGRGRGRSRR